MSKYEGRILKATAPTVTSNSASGIWSQEEAAKYGAAGTWPKQQFGDPDFASTTLLLHGDGTNGAQNNTFLDSSANNFTVTRGASTTQGTFTPFSKPDGRWGNYFDGSGDSLYTPNDAAFAFGTGAFTCEAWFYGVVGTTGGVLSSIDSGSGAYAAAIYFGSATTLNFSIQSNGAGAFTSAGNTFAFNTWNHVVLVRNGSGNVGAFLNGVRVGSGSTTQDITRNSFRIGATYTNIGNLINGYISNVRIVKGSAVYDPTQTTLTVPTEPLTAVAGTSLLTCQSNRFIDNSTNGFTITPAGDVKVTPFSPFPITTGYDTAINGGAVYLRPGSLGDYLSVPANAAFAPGTGDFTVDGWVYPLSGTGPVIYAQSVSGNTYFGIAFDEANSRIVFDSTPAGVNAFSGTVAKVNQWNHFSVTRASGVMTVTCNGVAGSPVNNTYNYTDTSMTPTIGSYSHVPGGAYSFGGYISNFRYIKGTAISGATVPTAPNTAVGGTATSLLLNFTNAGIFDNTGFNVLETVANAQVSTTTKKYGTGSISFDGTGDYLTTTGAGVFGTGDFTVEFWVNPSSVALSAIIDTRPGTDNAGAWAVQYDGTNLYWAGDGTSVLNVPVAQTPTGSWTHVAYTRESGTMKVWINGTQYGSSVSKTNDYTQTRFDIGVAVRTYYFTGFVDDLRITRGIARYTTTFTPPTQAFFNIGE